MAVPARAARSCALARPRLLVALACAVVVAITPHALALFTNPQTASPSVSAGSLAAPSPLSCTWSGTNRLTLSWTNTSPAVAGGYTYQRSNVSGSSYTNLGTTSGASSVSADDANPLPPTLRYYRVQATRSNWSGPYSNEVVSNGCAKTVRAFAGGGAVSCPNATTAANYKFNLAGTARGSIAADSSGNVYVADTGNACVVKIDTGGNVTMVAGKGATGNCGATTATTAKLTSPEGVAVDNAGNVYIADTGGDCILKVTPGGAASKVTGGGSVNNCTTTTAANLKLNGPVGIAVDAAGVLYVADMLNKCVRRIDTNGTVTNIAGTGGNSSTCASTGASANATPMGQPTGVAVDGSGRVFATDFQVGCVYRISSGTITQIAGNSSGTVQGCSFTGDPTTVTYVGATVPSVAVNAAGDAYFSVSADSNALKRTCVLEIPTGTSSLTASAGQNGTGNAGDDGPAIGAFFTLPTGIAVAPSNDLYIADATTDLVRRVITP